MKCLKCEAEIGECKVCPFCGFEKQTKDICIKCGKEGNSYYEGMCKECYDNTYGNEKDNDSEDKKNLCNKWWFYLIIVIVFIISSLYLYIQNSKPINNYKSQASNILSEYRQGKTTNVDTKNKIESLNQKVKKEYEKEETTQSLVLIGIFQRIEWDLTKGELSDTEISTYIQEIKNVK